MDMVIHPKEYDLDIATFGRSFYVFDDIRPLRELAQTGLGILDETIHIFEPPTAYIAQTQQASGTRFGGNAVFNGDNKKRGAMISYVINKPKKDKSDNKKEESKSTDKDKSEDKKPSKNDSIVLKVYNMKNELIRTLKEKHLKKMV